MRTPDGCLAHSRHSTSGSSSYCFCPRSHVKERWLSGFLCFFGDGEGYSADHSKRTSPWWSLRPRLWMWDWLWLQDCGRLLCVIWECTSPFPPLQGARALPPLWAVAECQFLPHKCPSIRSLMQASGLILFKNCLMVIYSVLGIHNCSFGTLIIV